MRPELDDTLAARPGAGARGDPRAQPEPTHTATAPRTPAQRDSTGSGEPAGLAPGQQLGHFRIDRPLGAGGMGEVYLATDLALERPVAIKVLPGGVARDPGRRDRLVREARAQARITHPNVGHIYFIGEEAGRLYFAMEYVAGETLSTRVAAGPLAVDDALAIVRSAALGLREAQRNGITHRDIKPSNLMIDGHGMVKVLDFGLAATADRADASSGNGAGPVAQTSLAGTPLYMAPEQARGEPVDHRADIYALGATLFHLVAGKPPFEADTFDALQSQKSSPQRPALPRRSGQPRTTIAAIDALCSQMMAPAPADRFASYDDLIRAIELTSVDHMRPAGLWVRSMAAFIDIMAAVMVAAALVMPLELLFTGATNHIGASFFFVYAVYATVLTARTGRTLGKWLFELEVVDVVTGRKPTLRRAAMRVILQVGAPCLGSAIGFVLGHNHMLGKILEVVFGVLSCAPPVLLLWASLRSVSKRTLWDQLGRTMVRYRTRRAPAI